MRRILFFALLLISAISFSQAPQYLNYQAIARDATGTIITSPIGIQFEIIQGSASGTVVYEETNNITPSTAGVFTAAIGGGSPVIGTFPTINWANSPYFVRVSIDPTGGTAYSTVGTSELLSVPYALYAETAGNTQTVNITGTSVTGAYPNYTITAPGALTPSTGISISGGTITNTAPNQTVNITGPSVSGTYPNYTIAPAGALTASTGISIVSGTITNTAPDQTVTISGAVGAYPNFTITPTPATTITPGNSNITVTGSDPNFTISSAPTLSLAGAVLSISNGNSITLPTGTTYTNGAGIALASGTIITNTAPNQTVTISNGTNVNVVGPYPNFTVSSTPTLSIASNTLSISGGNSVTLPASPTYSAGAGISLASGSITNTAPNQTVNVSGPGVIGTYPSYTVTAAPQTTVSSGSSNIIVTGSVPSFSVIALNPVIGGAGTTTVTNAGNNYTVNTPPVNMSFLPATGVLSYTPASGTNTINILPSLSFTNGVLTMGSNTTQIPGTGLWARQSTTATTLFNTTDLVGIGTNTPSSKLDITSTSFNLLSLTTTGGNSNVNVDAYPTGAGVLQLRVPTANGIGFTTSNITRMTIDPAGNVGVGTAGPSYPLHVQKSTAGTFVTSLENTGPSGWGLEVRTASSSSLQSAFEVYTGAVNRFQVRSDGYVGINTSSPTTKLHLYGVNSSTFMNAFSASPETSLRLHNDDLTNNNFSSLIFSTYATNATSFEAAKIIGVNSNHTAGSIGGDLVFMTRDPGNIFERMRITSNGNIGIRTQFPAAELEVNGYTKLGTNAPGIQVYKISGTTAAAQGNTANVILPAFIPPNKIISINVMVNWSGAAGDWIQPGYTIASGFEFNWYTSGNTVYVTNKNLTSGSILSKLFVVTVVYEQ